MKKLFVFIVVMTYVITSYAQLKAPSDMVVIESQPAGQLKMYNRSGYVIREVAREPEDPDNPYEIIRERQTGIINIVFADDGKVYFQHPTSFLTIYDGWIEGTLSEDGKTITVPMMQYIAYTKSLDMAVQIAMFKYDSEQNSYFYDESISEITYTINDDGSITQNGTSRFHILGAMNRAFGDTFSYLDYEWLQTGDYESVYTPFNEETINPPANLSTETYFLTTAEFDGVEWKGFASTVNLGYDGNDVWVKGLCKFLPQSWVKGRKEGSQIIIPDVQFLGTYEVPLYFRGVRVTNGSANPSDLVLTVKDNQTIVTTDYMYITTDEVDFTYITYYMGLTFSKNEEQPITVSSALQTEPYVFTYTTNTGENGSMEFAQVPVNLAVDGSNLYIQGLWEGMPEAWTIGKIEGDKAVFHMSQYYGQFSDEYLGTYPIYLTAFDEANQTLVEKVEFDYNAETKTLSNPTYPFSIGINKTGYISLQDRYEGAIITAAMSIDEINTDRFNDIKSTHSVYSIDGRQLNSSEMSKGINIIKLNNGAVRKVLR